MDVKDVDLRADTVVMNPPFGAQRRNADRPFLEAAVRIAPRVYSLHNARTLQFLMGMVDAMGCEVFFQKSYKFEIPHMFEFHEKGKKRHRGRTVVHQFIGCDKMSKMIVLPGDEVAVAEEYMPAEGTYEQDGKILSSLAGELELDQEEKVAKVSPKNPLVTLKSGDSVFCRITDVRASMAICEIFAAEGKGAGEITGDTSATIHVSKLSSGVCPGRRQGVSPWRPYPSQGHPDQTLCAVVHPGGALRGGQGPVPWKCSRPMVGQEGTRVVSLASAQRPARSADDYGDIKF